MAGERTLPGLGLVGFYDLGDDTWKDGMDANLRLVSALLAGSVVSRTTTLPVSGALGDIYLVPDGDANGNDLAIWDGDTGSEAWVFVTPKIGWSFYIADTNDNFQWDGTTWTAFAPSGGGGAAAFTDLTDTPAGYGTAGQVPTVNPTADGIIWEDMAAGGGGVGPVMPSVVTAATYATVDADFQNGKNIRRVNNAAGCVVTVTAGHASKGVLSFLQTGAGAISFAEDAGVTITSLGGLVSTSGVGSMVSLVPDADTAELYYLVGGLA